MTFNIPYGEPYDPMVEATRKRAEFICNHIESFAAAYFKQTNIPPDRAVMCRQLGYDGTERIWFEEKKDNDFRAR